MAVLHAGCGGIGFSWQSQRMLRERERWGFHGSPRLLLWMGEAGVLMAVPIAFWLDVRRGFSWQSQTLVVGGRSGGSHGSLRCWLFGLETGVFMAVPEAAFEGERRRFS